ncbi:DinB family protein [Flagellimonas sp. W118]|uniref:DinB family protein n=1 Tax=Flagellimonas sp. W118 TaxID=3410791 RepID=UPI003BF4E54D
MDSQIRKEFIENACYRMDESLRMIKTCLDRLPENVIWQKPNEVTNSIGNLILHLCGNITQYGIASLNGLEDNRNRDEEFSILSGYSKNELLNKLVATISKAKKSISEAPIEELLKKRYVQGFEFSGIGNIVHIVEHLSYHTGQIALWTKLLNNTDLGFYDGINLNTKNEN